MTPPPPTESAGSQHTLLALVEGEQEVSQGGVRGSTGISPGVFGSC